jgi:hypothetical protein
VSIGFWWGDLRDLKVLVIGGRIILKGILRDGWKALVNAVMDLYVT